MEQYKQKLTDLRNSFYDSMPRSGEISAWDMITWAKDLFVKFDEFIDTPPAEQAGDFEEALNARLDLLEEAGYGLDSRQYNFEQGARWAHGNTFPVVDGPWKFEVHNEASHPESGCSGDENVTITDGNITLYVDQSEDEEGERKLCNLLNQLKAKLSRTDDNEYMMYEYKRMYEEAVAQHQPSGMRWVKAFPEHTWRGCVKTLRPDGTTAIKLATYGKSGWLIDDQFNSEVVIAYLSESRAPQSDAVDAVDPVLFAGWIAKKYVVAVRDWPTDWAAEIAAYKQNPEY